jgi:hypothetical protein
MSSLEENINRCTNEAKLFAKKLENFDINDFCFSIEVPNDYLLSISIPCDIQLNKFSEDFNYPKVIETRLSHKEKSDFDTKLGYKNDNDIKRFYGKIRASEDNNVYLVKEHIHKLISSIKEE